MSQELVPKKAVLVLKDGSYRRVKVVARSKDFTVGPDDTFEAKLTLTNTKTGQTAQIETAVTVVDKMPPDDDPSPDPDPPGGTGTPL